MASEIEMLKENPEGDIKVNAIYKTEDEFPQLVTIEDRRFSDKNDKRDIKMIYKNSTHSLGVKNIDPDYDFDPDEQNLIDEEIMDMIYELYDGQVEIYDYYSYASVKKSLHQIITNIGASMRELFKGLLIIR